LISNRVYTWLAGLDVKIMRLMDIHKMIFPRIDTRHPMDKHMEQLGLGPQNDG